MDPMCMDPMCMEAVLSLSSPVAVSSTSTSQHEGDVSVIVPNSVAGLIQSSVPIVQGGKSFAGLFKSPVIETLPLPSVSFKKEGGIGVLLRLDKATSDGDFGHYARVLVDVDVSSVLRTSVLFERDEFHSSFIAVEYENLSAFCSTCSSIGHLHSSCHWNKSSKTPLSSTTKSTQDIVGYSRVFGDDGFQPVRTRSSKSVYRPIITPQEEVPLSNVFSVIHQDVGGHDSVVVHTSVGSNLISGSTSSAGLVLSSNPSSSIVSAISEVASSLVPPMISQALQISKDSGFDDGVTDSILVSSSSVVDPSISSISSDVGVVHYSRTVIQGSSVVNRVRPVVSTILFRSSSRSGHTARQQVRVHEVSDNQSSEEAIVSLALNVNVDQSSLRDGFGFSCSSVVDPKV
ncbi:hypothetical protein LWI28_005594 [Acer negundo]|uniref:Zinc knuckle CX2CX4HX4C domain-containing protein n=1 Tax=Acer negundo TaxID=4023 RepID=A0AAD5P138_ACENE|nr:hypothetical protein LWI28_005594 [Acer negundo]